MIMLHLPKANVEVAIEAISEGQLLITNGGNISFRISGDNLLPDLVDILTHQRPSIEPNQNRQWKYQDDCHGHEITFEMVKEASTIEEKLRLLILRFEDIDRLEPDLALIEALKIDYKRHTGRDYRAKAIQPDQGEQALKRLRPYAHELLDKNGQPVWGAKTRVQKILGLPNSGGAYHQQITAALEALQLEVAA